MKKTDILIIGGGPVGLLLYRLLQDLPYQTAIIEKNKSLVDKDLRSYILNANLIKSLCDAGYLNQEDTLAIEQLIVSHYQSIMKFRLDQDDDPQQAHLKYIVGAQTLRESLAQGLNQQAGIYTGALVQSLQANEEGYLCTIKQAQKTETIQTRLPIIADGTQSYTAKLLDIPSTNLSPSHQAKIMSLKTDRGQIRVAEQRLWANGVASIVPSLGGRLVCVYVGQDRDILAAEDPVEINDYLQQVFCGRYGRLQLAAPPFNFTIQPVRRPATHQAAIVLGDAACTLSPVAAQGLSLGMDSCLSLQQYLKTNQPDLSQREKRLSFIHQWHTLYTQKYHRKQNLNQLYARLILSSHCLRSFIPKTMAMLSLSHTVRKILQALLSE